MRLKIIAYSADGPNLAVIMAENGISSPQKVYVLETKWQNIHLNEIPSGCVASFHVAFLSKFDVVQICY